MNKQSIILASAIAALSTPVFAGTVTSDGADIVIKTKGGFEAETADGDYSFSIGGRMQVDYDNFDDVINTEEGETGSDMYFRRARLEIKGHAKAWKYEVSYNLTEGGSIDQLHTTYTGFGNLAEVTVGQQKEDFGLEDTGSSKWITAIERSMPASAFDTGNNMGVKLHGANDMFTYSLGGYKEGIDSNNDLDWAGTGRLVYRPYMDGSNLIHLGVGYTARSGADADYNARLGVRGSEDGGNVNRVRARLRYPDNSYYTGDESDYNLEAAVNWGAFNVMAEYFNGEIDVDGASEDIDADGYYVTAAWVITGESRAYKTGIGAFDKVKPSGSDGAWEVFVRYDDLDLNGNSAPISVTAGQADSITAGVNWYYNSMIKMALNYVHVNTDQEIGGEDSGNAIAARLQVVF